MLSIRFRTSCFALTVAACTSAAALDEQPTTQLPYTPSLDPEAMDLTADPCEDLYQYSCGGWIRNNPIPADQSSWSIYGKAYVDNQRYLWGLLQEDSVDHPQRNATQTLIGDYFAACMNESAIEALGSTPLDPDLQAITAVTDKNQLADVIGQLISHTDTSAFFLAVGSEQDAEESSKMIGAIFAGGLGLPDRDYYFDASDNKAATRQAYLDHVAAMFVLLGESPQQAQNAAATVMRIETGLAGASLTQVERRDPHKVYHRKSAQEVAAVAPAFDWQALFARTGLDPNPWLNLSQPEFIAEMQATITRESLDDLKTYLRWGLVNTRAQQLAKAFRDQDFAFYGTHLRGIKEQRPRWRTCVGQVDAQLGEALGREFVERNFPPELREKALHMTLQIQQAMARAHGPDRLDEP